MCDLPDTLHPAVGAQSFVGWTPHPPNGVIYAETQSHFRSTRQSPDGQFSPVIGGWGGIIAEGIRLLQLGADGIGLEEGLNTLPDSVSNLPNPLNRLAFRVWKRPIISSKTRYVGAFIPTSHGDEKLGVFSQLRCQPPGL